MSSFLQKTVLNISQMRVADSLASAKGKSVAMLMENAGFAVAAEISKRFFKKKVIVLCGFGNNGGDGFVVARILKTWGWHVDVYLLGDESNLKEPARSNAEFLKSYNITIKPLSFEALKNVDKNNAIIVDAIFGAGLSRAVDGLVKDLILAINSRELLCVGVDVPSGVCGDDGNVSNNIAVKCQLTVTFCRKKLAHLLYPAKDFCGEVVVADIGIDDEIIANLNLKVYENSIALWDVSPPDSICHKYERGYAMVVGGYPMTGAARLSTLAARRAGAGMVTSVVPVKAFAIYSSENAGNIVQAYENHDEFQEIINNEKIDVILFGPGAGKKAETINQLTAISKTQKTMVIDADALSVFAGRVEELKGLLREDTIITPHNGELLRIFPQMADISSKAEQALKASVYLNCIVVLKGADTIIASPCGKVVINSDANPYLATAGSGDVLAGIITSFVAQGMKSFDSACLGVLIHSEAANKIGKNLIAEDIIAALKN